MNKLSKEVGIELHKGAGSIVDEQIKEISSKYGKEYLNKIAKLNFKNTIKAGIVKK